MIGGIILENKYGKFLKIEGTETWQEALERLKKFCHEDLDEPLIS